jgi:preprotein translocase subunit Sec63
MDLENLAHHIVKVIKNKQGRHIHETISDIVNLHNIETRNHNNCASHHNLDNKQHLAEAVHRLILVNYNLVKDGLGNDDNYQVDAYQMVVTVPAQVLKYVGSSRN